ncbi:tautomerase family protein [Sphingomonas sp. CROZ-RG-20F-R02-07]|uniref:tautomerase family protein n=1 Tax=Sphingomonas sp. CROZ-RG-20F-R02-07 TaxID=2914832 RepID=UPI001F57E115
MPLFHISMRKGTFDEYRRAIADSVHQGMLDSMGLPEDDFFSVIHELYEANFRYPVSYWNIPRTERMIFIQFW